MNAFVLLTTVGIGSIATLGMLIYAHLWKKKQDEEQKKKMRPIRVRKQPTDYR